MDKDRINALACECAAERAEESGLSDDTINELFEAVTANAEDIILWLSRRFYFVEKSKVTNEYKDVAQAVAAYRTQNLVLNESKLAKADLLFTLFPEIAKEVEG